MTRNEKILSVAVGLLLFGLGMIYVMGKITTAFDVRNIQRSQLETTISSNRKLINKANRAGKRQEIYEMQSLPRDVHIGNSAYRAWLHKIARAARLDKIEVSYDSGLTRGDVLSELTFSLSGNGDLEQVTALLYEFHKADYLHQITKLDIEPARNSKQLTLRLTAEALSLSRAGNEPVLPERESDLLELPTLDDYVAVIVRRNALAPGNNPPRFTSADSQRLYLGKEGTIQLRARANDDDQELRFALLRHTIPNVDPTLDTKSGRIALEPDTEGEFEIVVEATDDGLPAKSVQQTIKVSVSNPPPPRVVEKKPVFDQAKFAFLTAIVEVNGKPKLWLSVRTTGQSLELGQGEEFSIGEVQGLVAKIHRKSVEVDLDGKRMLVRCGQNLREGQLIAAATKQPPATTVTEDSDTVANEGLDQVSEEISADEIPADEIPEDQIPDDL